MYNNIKIGFIGFGSVGKQLYNTMLECGYSAQQIFIFADDHNMSTAENRYPFNDYMKNEFNDLYFIPTLGYLSKVLKLNVLNKLIESQKKLFTFIHPTAFVSKNAKIGQGVIIYPLCNIDQGAEIGDGSIILNSSIIAHDTKIGKCVYLAPGVCMSGFITVGDLTFIGSGAVISNNISIGNNSTIAVGTCLTKSIEENSCVIGNPFVYKKSLTLI